MSIAKTMSIPSVDLFFVVSDEDWGLAKAIIKKEIDKSLNINKMLFLSFLVVKLHFYLRPQK